MCIRDRPDIAFTADYLWLVVLPTFCLVQMFETCELYTPRFNTLYLTGLAAVPVNGKLENMDIVLVQPDRYRF